MNLKKLGILGYFDTMSGVESVEFARVVEKLGYSVLWVPETFGRDPFVMATHLLNATRDIVVGTAIANVWKREAIATGAAARTIAELFTDRFILGLGVSAGPFMIRNGLKYAKPVTFMREYLASIKSGPFKALMPPAHIARLRRELGPSKLLLAQQMVMLEKDAEKARAGVRAFMRFYLNASPYQRNFKAMGFSDDDLRGGGSDHLVDSIIAWGDERHLHERIAQHYAAGANHVYVIPLTAAGDRLPDMRVVEALAPN